MSILKKFKLKEVKVSDLKEWEINPRIHSDKGLSDVRDSISKFGIVSFMYCDKDLTIVGGHARKKVLIDLGVETVKCWVAMRKLSKRDFKVAALLSNKIYSSFNQGEINDCFNADDLICFGFDDDEVDFDDDTELGGDDVGVSGSREVKHVIRLKFRTKKEMACFEDFISDLESEYNDTGSDSERFINYLRENL